MFTHHDSHAVEVGAGAGGRGRGVGHSGGAGLTDVYAVCGKIEGAGCHLDHLSVQTLAHLRATVGQQHRAVSVHVNQSSGLHTQTHTHMLM